MESSTPDRRIRNRTIEELDEIRRNRRDENVVVPPHTPDRQIRHRTIEELDEIQRNRRDAKSRCLIAHLREHLNGLQTPLSSPRKRKCPSQEEEHKKAKEAKLAERRASE